ncbi:hypothetical protein [Novipirellula aureliae]|nr:hypothetical protein [Novipirellula aureliae]
MLSATCFGVDGLRGSMVSVVRDPAVRDPAVRDPAVRDPAVRDPAVRDPAMFAAFDRRLIAEIPLG